MYGVLGWLEDFARARLAPLRDVTSAQTKEQIAADLAARQRALADLEAEVQAISIAMTAQATREAAAREDYNAWGAR